MLTLVNQQVAGTSSLKDKQMPYFRSTLTKFIKFEMKPVKKSKGKENKGKKGSEVLCDNVTLTILRVLLNTINNPARSKAQHQNRVKPKPRHQNPYKSKARHQNRIRLKARHPNRVKSKARHQNLVKLKPRRQNQVKLKARHQNPVRSKARHPNDRKW